MQREWKIPVGNLDEVKINKFDILNMGDTIFFFWKKHII